MTLDTEDCIVSASLGTREEIYDLFLPCFHDQFRSLQVVVLEVFLRFLWLPSQFTAGFRVGSVTTTLSISLQYHCIL